MRYKSQGFTLVEILLAIAILAILASITVVAINPSRQLANARDAERLSDVYTILSAIHQYASDNESAFPEVIQEEEFEVCVTDASSCDGMYDLSVLTDNQTYLVAMPIDPLCVTDETYCTENGTGYFIEKTQNGRITISAPLVEIRDDITITR